MEVVILLPLDRHVKAQREEIMGYTHAEIPWRVLQY